MGGFTFIEVCCSLAVLALICAMIFPTVSQSMKAYGCNRAKLDAFDVARENMENLLASGSVTEKVDYGASDKNPNIEWETVVEAFELDDGMWVRAICSASYRDANDQPQKVELVHWLTQVPKDIAAQMMKDRQLRDSNEAGQAQDFNEPGMSGQGGNPSQNQRSNSGRPDAGSDQLQQFLNSVNGGNK